MAKNDNLKDFITDIADAIRQKKGSTELINPQDFSNEIINIQSSTGGSSPSRPTYTGHADVEGLKAIGWTDEDIAYYQANGVNWNEEDDEYHKVPEDNIALYGVLTASNISIYKDRIVYLPKIDTSGRTSMGNMFSGFAAIVAIPQLDTSNVTNMSGMFYNCYSFVSIPQLDTSNVTNMSDMLYYCYSIQTAKLKGIKNTLLIIDALLFKKDSLLYIINNEASTSAITITLRSYSYNKYATDPDVVAALSNHPNISLAK